MVPGCLEYYSFLRKNLDPRGGWGEERLPMIPGSAPWSAGRGGENPSAGH